MNQIDGGAQQFSRVVQCDDAMRKLVDRRELPGTTSLGLDEAAVLQRDGRLSCHGGDELDFILLENHRAARRAR